ncbi:MAG: hypothetical protein AAB847_00735 [Patescibacteria group bacterium]
MAQRVVGPGIVEDYACGKLIRIGNVLIVSIIYNGKEIKLKSEPLKILKTKKTPK